MKKNPIQMGNQYYSRFILLCFLLSQLFIFKADGFDQLDPHGNITIKWDILSWEDDQYDAQISIHNYQSFRHIERPGWALSWTWRGDEVIWNMVGGEAREQGDCRRIKTKAHPHCCMKQPVIIDLLPGVPMNMQTSNCCKAGVLTTINQDPARHGAFFRMTVGKAMLISEIANTTAPNSDDDPQKKHEKEEKEKKKNHDAGVNEIHSAKKEQERKNKFPRHDSHKKRVLIDSDPAGKDRGGSENATLVNQIIPGNFSIGVRGYTCGPPERVAPTRFAEDKGRRHTQALFTWKFTCTYSQTAASQAPTCCVSMSSFYNKTIVSCPKCSCACHGDPTKHCIDPTKGVPSLIQLPHGEDEVLPPKVWCTEHMCPIRIHWHVKTSYKKHWRVKVTVHNLNFVKNYSQWSLVVQHPNLKSLVQTFSFNYKPLHLYPTNDTGMFWGIPFYNDLLIQAANDTGNVQTEILLEKDPGFTFGGGFGFPRKISFNGDACVMPPPDQYPRLPNSSFSLSSNSRPILFSLCLLLLSLVILY